jgi:nickel-dependent lactate racemase
MSIFNELLGNVPIPKFVKVRQKFPRPKIENIEKEINKEIMQKKLLNNIRKGDRIAVTAGSRGIANIDRIIREIARNIKEAGGQPFIVPAMGSHGGANAEGQVKVLNSMGITEKFCEAPIKSSMEVVKIGETEDGLPVYIDKYANEADGIVVINRIKPHVGFRGPYESGIVKMITIGLGKQKGAEVCHHQGFGKMAENLPKIASVVIEKKNIVFAIGLLENAYDETYKIIAMDKEQILNIEPKLQKESKSMIPKIYFDKFDILVLDEIGKNITGTGMDTNIIGRYHTPYASGGPKIKKIVVLDLTNESHGNANGIGLSDFTTKRFFDKMRFDQTYPNSITSTVQETIKIPMVLDNDKLAIQGAIKTSNLENESDAKIVRIKNTLDMEYIYISENLIEEAKQNPNLEIIGVLTPPNFNEYGNLF